jgi:hypothetical protein
MIPIKSFRDVHVPTKALVVLDIDDTVMRFEELGRSWWAKKEAELTAIHGYAKAREEVMQQWVAGAHIYMPILTDPDDFPKFLTRVFDAGAHLVFLTARSADLRQLTEFHMTSCGIDVESERIYFSREKGATLKSIVGSGGFSKVVFIDDMEHNIESVLSELKGQAEVQAYHFQKYIH